ncbi:hypothetical protein EYF80_010434 [Liparis tanakae]|uniref:Uncharacterized protein n=1 Tax=Liparis tanakae TaxID=230148 RepID=A0A4Z2IMY3_9TELE|nr:hypothetical protein EYF80_010434 [Liparis tanakae]
MFAGRSSTPQSTRMRHSGQRSSFRELRMFSRQRRQKVCWHGSTLAVVSRRSRHTEHSRRSSRDEDSSMSAERVSIWASVSVGVPRRLARVPWKGTGGTAHSGRQPTDTPRQSPRDRIRPPLTEIFSELQLFDVVLREGRTRACRRWQLLHDRILRTLISNMNAR